MDIEVIFEGIMAENFIELMEILKYKFEIFS